MISDYSTAVRNIQNEFRNYLLNSKLKSIVAGISGGIDSALCIALARKVCDEAGVKLIGRSITIQTNKPDEIQRSIAVGKAFAHDFKEVNLSESFAAVAASTVENYDKQSKDDFAYKIRLGNLKARTRMMYLYDLAAANKGLVLSTDNYTELLLGFWTLHGDVGDYGMIQNLWKTEVYGMAEYLCEILPENQSNSLKLCVEAVPTDGLGITNSDLDQIGASSYAEVDKILIDYLKKNEKSEYINHKVVQRKINSEFKRNNPYNIPRNLITDTDYY